MTKTGTFSIAFIVGYLLVSTHQLIDQVTIEKKCDPSIGARMNDCPKGYCCVRDEFLPTYVYCKKMGLKHEDCTIRTTESNCPCVHGLYCKPNIQSATFHSLYGKCQPSDNATHASPVITG